MRPARENFESQGRTYFVSSQTGQRRPLFRNERWATLLQQVLEHYRSRSYELHAYVVMPDHFHALLTPTGSLERAVQHVKGGFSFRAKQQFGWNGEIWQAGFTDHRIRDDKDWANHIAYIEQNPVRQGLSARFEDYPYLRTGLDPIPQRLKPLPLECCDGGAEAPPLPTRQGGTAVSPENTRIRNRERLNKNATQE